MMIPTFPKATSSLLSFVEAVNVAQAVSYQLGYNMAAYSEDLGCPCKSIPDRKESK